MYEGLAIATAQFEDPTPFPNTVSRFLGGFFARKVSDANKKIQKTCGSEKE